MHRGTTPTVNVIVDADLSDMTLYLAFKQPGKPLLVKTGADLDVEVVEDDGVVETHITVKLSQAETLDLREGAIVKVQLRAVADGGDVAVASDIATCKVYEILQDGELHG